VTRAGVGIALVAALAVGLSGGGARAASETKIATAISAPTVTAKPTGKSKSKRKGPAAPKRPVLGGERVEVLRVALLGPDDEASAEAARAFGQSGAIGAAEPLVGLLAMGATPTRTQAALDALGQLAEVGALGADNRAIEVLELYAGHRTPDLRRRAVKALGAVKEDRAAAVVVPALVARLGDAAPDVRATAGESLAARREVKAATPRLYALVKRGDPGAAGPLAALAPPDLIPQIAELAGSVDDGVLATVLGEYVKRDDVPDKLRVDVLRTIGGLAGAGATTALVEYLASVPAKDARPSKKEAQKLLDERGSKQ